MKRSFLPSVFLVFLYLLMHCIYYADHNKRHGHDETIKKKKRLKITNSANTEKSHHSKHKIVKMKRHNDTEIKLSVDCVASDPFY